MEAAGRGDEAALLRVEPREFQRPFHRVGPVVDKETFLERTGRELTEQFPLVLANIQAHVLRELKAALVARMAPGGTLILSGLLTPQAQPIADEFVAAGLRLERVRPSTDDPQWSSVTLRR